MFKITSERKMKVVNLKIKISECDIDKELRISSKMDQTIQKTFVTNGSLFLI